MADMILRVAALSVQPWVWAGRPTRTPVMALPQVAKPREETEINAEHLQTPHWEGPMPAPFTRGKRVVPGLLLGLCLLLLALAPDKAQAQSARFDEFSETSPKAGEMAPDFDLLTLENEPFNLMAMAAETPIVIEFGSFT